MKKSLIVLLSLIIVCSAFSQSKKEQIETLTFKVDSLQQLIFNERTKNKVRVNELDEDISKLRKEMVGVQKELTQATIALLEQEKASKNKQLAFDERERNLLDSISFFKKELDSLQNKTHIDLHFSLNVSNKRASPATCISFIADNTIVLKEGNNIIAVFQDSGQGFLSDEKDIVSIKTETASERTYSFEKREADEITVIQHFYLWEMDIDRDTWRKTYKKDLYNNWKLVSCDGDCE